MVVKTDLNNGSGQWFSLDESVILQALGGETKKWREGGLRLLPFLSAGKGTQSASIGHVCF